MEIFYLHVLEGQSVTIFFTQAKTGNKYSCVTLLNYFHTSANNVNKL